MTASVDGASAAPLERAGAEPFLELSSGAVLLFVNSAQATVLTGRDDPEQAARVLTAWYPHVAVKMAADGALFYANAGRRCGCPRCRWTGWWTAPAPGTRSSPASCPPGWTRSRRASAGRRLPAGRARARPHRRPACSLTGYIDDLFSLDGRIAVVTGGSSGIGAGMAAALARAGARVVLVARDAERLEESAAALRARGAEAACVSTDLARRPAVAQAADEAEAAFGPPDSW